MLLLPLVDKILAIVQRTGLVQEGMEEIAVNAQTALYTLKILCRHLGEKNPHTFIKVTLHVELSTESVFLILKMLNLNNLLWRAT